MNYRHYAAHLRQSAHQSLLVSVAIITIIAMCYLLIEPVVSRAAAGPGPHTFSIHQTILDESTFLVAPADVDMAGDLNGVTGGTATGTTYFVVQSNNTAGYSVNIAFFNNSTPNAMIGDISGSEAIRDYNEFGPGTDPTFLFAASTSAQFGYTVFSSSTADTAAAFLYDGGNICNNGGALKTIVDRCWMEPLTTSFTIVDVESISPGDPSITGATSTIKFLVRVPAGATPVPNAETYTATATLSLLVN